MNQADKQFRNAMIAFLAELESANQSTKEYAAERIKIGLEGKLSEGGQVFIDELCELILTGEPNDVTKFLGLTP